MDGVQGQFTHEELPDTGRLFMPAGAIEHWLERDAEFGIIITDEKLVIRFCNQWLRRRSMNCPAAGRGVSGTAGNEASGGEYDPERFNPNKKSTDEMLFRVFPELKERRLDRYYEAALAGQVQILSQRFHRRLISLPADKTDVSQPLMDQTARIYPLVDGARIAGTLTVIEDVTERLRREEEFRQTIRKQGELIAAIDRAKEISQSMTALSQTLISTASLEDISHLVLKMAQELTGSANGFTGYIDTQTGALVSPTLSRTAWDICKIKEKTVTFPRFVGLFGWVLNNRRTLLTNDAAADPRAAGRPAGHPPIVRFLSAPALFEGRLVGQLAVANSSRDYTDQDLLVITRLADLYALAVFRRLTENQLHDLSITDELTGLYNRRGFLTLAAQQLRIAERTKRGHLILFADLDGLKWINDILGHQEGDLVLQDAANLLRRSFRESDIIARLGGDEFAVLALESAPADGETLTAHLREEVGMHNEAANRPYLLSISIGMAFYDPGSRASLDELLTQADMAMYEDKSQRRRDAAAVIR